ncbi:MAG: DNA repair helicase XPB [Gemmatimonadota bacterium]
MIQPQNPLIVQGDHTVLVELASPRYETARDALLSFAELVKSPEHVHTYRITPLSIWNACATGLRAEAIIEALRTYAKYPVPDQVERGIRDFAARYGRLTLTRDGATLVLTCSDAATAERIARDRHVAPLLGTRFGTTSFRVDAGTRGRLKLALMKCGFPADDRAGYVRGQPVDIGLRAQRASGEPLVLRAYQLDAVRAFHGDGESAGGSGVIVLPCGAGKTVVGLACMAQRGAATLVLTTGITAARQWVEELLDKTTLTPADIGVFHGAAKQIRPVTIATYQILTHRASGSGEFTHLSIFDEQDWGLIIYDEVHLLPAPVFQVTAHLQARRRLGLTATLVREDGREDDVFALIGPKKLDVPWKLLERQGWIAKAECTEVRMAMSEQRRMDYALAEPRAQYRIAAENPDKLDVVMKLLARHADAPTLVIGMYVEQLGALAAALGVPLITGSTPQQVRDDLYRQFRSGEVRVLVVSKVANFAIDLPDAAVAIQVSGTFGSRQEEAQRLGRILRPKRDENQAHFYTLVSADTVEQDFALRRQLFLCEQGYAYRIVDADMLTAPTLRLVS